MPSWPDQIRRSVGARSTEDPSQYLTQLSEWFRRTRNVASEHSRHATKEAVQSVDPTEEEQQALMALFADQAETIYWVCSDALDAYSRSGHAEEPSLELQDLLAEAYPLFLRALVRYQGNRPLEIHVRRAFRDRIRSYIESHLRHPTPSGESGEPSPIPEPLSELPEVDVGEICRELQEEGIIPVLDAESGPSAG